jgi:hypothetical protein
VLFNSLQRFWLICTRPDRNMLYADGAIKMTNPLASG